MLASFSEFERATITERSRDGLHRAFKNGKLLGCIPFGYDISDDGAFVVVEDEARIVREIVANVAAGAPSTPKQSASTTRTSRHPGASTGADRVVSTAWPGATQPYVASSASERTLAPT